MNLADKIEALETKVATLLAQGKRKAARRVMSRIGGMRAAMWRIA